jgi:hypothetical protein
MSKFQETSEAQHFDYIVVGLGGHGSATISHLAVNNPTARILGIEQFQPAHGNGKLISLIPKYFSYSTSYFRFFTWTVSNISPSLL